MSCKKTGFEPTFQEITDSSSLGLKSKKIHVASSVSMFEPLYLVQTSSRTVGFPNSCATESESTLKGRGQHMLMVFLVSTFMEGAVKMASA